MYQKTLNIWALEPQQAAQLTPGQWITAGEHGPKGRYLGVKESGAIVAAWQDNARRAAGGYFGYLRALRAYAKGRA